MEFIPEVFHNDRGWFYEYYSEREFKKHGIRWNDLTLAIQWPVENPVVSAKDAALPSFDEFIRKSVTSQS